jgi:hypothetical protein
MEVETKKDFVNLLFIPPIANKFDFYTRGSDIKTVFESFFEKRKDYIENKLAGGKMKIFKALNYQNEIEKFILENKDKKKIIINYPKNEKQAKELSILANIRKIFVINVSSYENISKMMNDYIICPVCEISYEKSKHCDERNFYCPKDKNSLSLSVSQLEKYKEEISNEYFKNFQDVVNYLLQDNSGLEIDKLNIEEYDSEEKILSKIK